MQDFQFRPGKNCWRIEKASCFSFIIDGQAYFRALRESLLKAERMALMVGWDFDFEIDMLPGESDADGQAPDGFPNKVGPFLDALAERRPGLDIYLLKWSGGALIAPGGILPAARVKFMSPAQIHLAFDGRHPIGACHHQKVVVIDDSLAFCGGIDVTDGRWDTPEHDPENDLRRLKSGQIAQPWHDASAVISGPAAAALSELVRDRWERANDAPVDEDFRPGADLWPDSIRPMLANVDLAIARTEPPTTDAPPVAEIEQLYLDSIDTARDVIYLESQYFCCDSITRAIKRRLIEADGPEVVIIQPDAAQKMIEDQAMHITRSRMVRDLRAHDYHGRFRIFYPVDAAGQGIYVHAKISIIDDTLLRVGSSNIDRRSMGFDTECDVALAGTKGASRRMIAAMRDRLLAEHLDTTPEAVAAAVKEHGSLISAIEALNPRTGRSLRELPLRRESFLGRLLADTRFFDPRYRASAKARVGVTSRHLMIGAGLLAGGALIWRQFRGKNRPGKD